MKSKKAYLGDGVYVDTDGYQLLLTTEDGIRVTNRVFLDSQVYEAMIAYVERLKKQNNPQPQSEE